MTDEEPLTGGNVSAGVVRVGDTVRRPAGPHPPAVHALLRHLHAVGFRHVPRPPGFDERGREVLSFVPGTGVVPDRVDLLDGDRPVREIGRLVRDLHDACAEFAAPPWRTRSRTSARTRSCTATSRRARAGRRAVDADVAGGPRADLARRHGDDRGAGGGVSPRATRPARPGCGSPCRATGAGPARRSRG